MNNFKVVGIGLSKTGTKSLNAALCSLGYKSIHCPQYTVKNGWVEINQDLSGYDAMTDISAILNYKEIAMNNKECKFVLTTRNQTDWISSCNRHWHDGYTYSPNESKLLDAIYYINKFDFYQFLHRYVSHTKEVVSFFLNNNMLNRLLILDLGADNKMGLLKSFLCKSGQDGYPCRK